MALKRNISTYIQNQKHVFNRGRRSSFCSIHVTARQTKTGRLIEAAGKWIQLSEVICRPTLSYLATAPVAMLM
jgi:hypothetical protein